MSTKPIFPCTLLLILLGLGTARAQVTAVAPDLGDPNTAPRSELAEARPTQIWPPQTGPSTWIVYKEQPGCECCGPIGGCGPIRMELYAGTGPSLAVAGELIAHSIDDGWIVEGGGRTLFFNRDLDAAWNIDLKLSYIFNEGRSNLNFPFPEIQNNADGTQGLAFEPVTVAALHRTYVSLGIGREWFLPGPTLSGQKNWIIGIDGGARYGVVRLDVHNFDILGQFQRHTDTLWGGYAGVHTDLECPCNCCTFLVGFRAEWSAMIFRIPVHAAQHIYDVNLLLTTGVRF